MAPFVSPINVVLPALDEADAIGWVLQRLPDRYHPIVVDNGSTDATASIARAHGATVVDEPVRGFGAACWAGLRAATTPIVCIMDCDASLDPAELDGVVEPLDHGWDLVLGARRPTCRRAMPPHARLANRYLARQLRRRFDYQLTDLGPMRAAHRTQLIALAMQDRRSGFPLETLLLAGRAGWSVCERPVTYRPRHGRSKVTGTVSGALHAATDMNRLLRTPPR
jgi:glycosyltransferase involved in cell wall biosynthesis